MRRLAITLVLLFWIPTLASADVGHDESTVTEGVLAAIHAKPLSQVGDDAIRFSNEPALGGPAWVVEWHRDSQGFGEGTVTFLYWHRSEDPSVTGVLQLGLSREAYAELSAKIDELLRRPERVEKYRPRLFFVCTDGPGYLTERRTGGVTTWLTGFCGDHPNNAISKLISTSVWSNLCPYAPATPSCAAHRKAHRPR
jgi:hypothetical protein